MDSVQIEKVGAVDKHVGQQYLSEFLTYAESFNVYAEREVEVKLLMCAVLNKEHVLFKGIPGTAKSQLAMNFLGNIQGSQLFKQQFTAFMDESYIFGPQLIDELKKGVIKHNTQNSVVDADFAFLDEFFNANEETLIACNEVLNERTFTRNGQQESCPLITAVMTTNQEREGEKKLIPIYDRIMFTSKVLRVENEDNRRKMYKNAMRGMLNVSSTFDYDKLKAIHEYIDSIRVDFSDIFLTLLDRLLVDFQNQSGLYISDRKVVKSLKFLKIVALLNNRFKVVPADLEELKYVWTILNEPVVESVFDACFVKIQTEFVKLERELKMIEEITSLVEAAQLGLSGAIGYGELKEVKGALTDVLIEIAKIRKDAEIDAETDAESIGIPSAIEDAEKVAKKLIEETSKKMAKFRQIGVIDEQEQDDFDWFKNLQISTTDVKKQVPAPNNSAIETLLGG